MIVDEAYRFDLLIEDQVVVELKATEKVLPVHGAQLLSYLRLSGKSLGLLVNFNVPLLTDGVIRRINSGAADHKTIRCVDFAPKAHRFMASVAQRPPKSTRPLYSLRYSAALRLCVRTKNQANKSFNWPVWICPSVAIG